MQKSKIGLNWYFNNLFIHPYSELLVIFVLTMQIISLEVLHDISQFIIITQLLLLPMFNMGTGLHVMRDTRTTIFEISLVGNYDSLAYSKILISLLGVVPFLVSEVLILSLSGYTFLILPILASTLVLVSFILISSLGSSTAQALLISVMLVYFIPFSAYLLELSLIQFHYRQPFVVGVLLNLLLPMLTSQFGNQILSLNPVNASLLNIAIALIFMVLYRFLFSRISYNPR